jgi:hypothetical protein
VKQSSTEKEINKLTRIQKQSKNHKIYFSKDEINSKRIKENKIQANINQ